MSSKISVGREFEVFSAPARENEEMYDYREGLGNGGKYSEHLIQNK